MKCLIIDGAYVLYNAYHKFDNIFVDEIHTGALYGFIKTVDSLIERFKPDAVAVALEKNDKSWRKEIFPAYKANRLPWPAELIHQIDLAQEFLKLKGIQCLIQEGIEGDDLIWKYTLHRDSHIIASVDKDLYQLVSPTIQYWHLKKEILMGESEVKEIFGVYPWQVASVLSLAGDSADGVPGCQSIGIKTATKVIGKEKYATLNSIPRGLTQKQIDSLSDNFDKVKLSEELVALGGLELYKRITVDTAPRPYIPQNGPDLISFMEKYNMRGAIRRIEESKKIA